MALREFDLSKVNIYGNKVEEFEIGSHITFHNEYTGERGSGTIFGFALSNYTPTVWYTDDSTKDIKCTCLGWCRVDNTKET